MFNAHFLTGPKWKLSNIAHEDEMLVFIAIKEHQKWLITSVSHARDHPFKTSANFHDFWPLPPSLSAFFLLLSVGKIGQFLIPPP